MLESFDVHICAVQIDEDMDTFLVMLADDANNPNKFVEFQRSLQHDDQDIELGMDTYCIVTSSGATHYGGIISCVMIGGNLSVDFSDEAKSILGVDGYRLALRLSEPEKKLLASGLNNLFEDGKDIPQQLILEWSN